MLEEINVSFEEDVIAGVHADEDEDGDENDDIGKFFTVSVQLKGVSVTRFLLEQ